MVSGFGLSTIIASFAPVLLAPFYFFVSSSTLSANGGSSSDETGNAPARAAENLPHQSILDITAPPI